MRSQISQGRPQIVAYA